VAQVSASSSVEKPESHLSASVLEVSQVPDSRLDGLGLQQRV